MYETVRLVIMWYMKDEEETWGQAPVPQDL